MPLHLRKEYWIFSSICITILAFLLSRVVVYDISSISYFAPMEKASDFRISDFYQIVANNQAVQSLDPNIVVVNVDDCSRTEIADVIEQVNLCAPRVIGLDLFFDYPSADGELLCKTLGSCKRLVLPLYLCYDAFDDLFEFGSGSFFYNQLSNAEYGAINLVGNNSQSNIREFRPIFPGKQDTIYNFVTTLALLAAPENFNRLIERDNTYEAINYASSRFHILNHSEIPLHREILRDKIVLIGTINDIQDYHLTPTDTQMPGVIIHAHALSTILRGDYLYQSSVSFDWMAATILCLIMVGTNIFLRDKKMGSLIIRLLQLFLLYLIVSFGCYLYIRYHICVNFSQSLLMVTFGLIASDIWYGGIGFWEWINNKWRHIKIKATI